MLCKLSVLRLYVERSQQLTDVVVLSKEEKGFSAEEILPKTCDTKVICSLSTGRRLFL